MMVSDGEFIKRWEEFKKRWKYYVPIISVDKFFHDTIDEMKSEYPVWKKLIEELKPDEDGFKVISGYIRSLWGWIWKWF